jgi:hypothetical protein
MHGSCAAAKGARRPTMEPSFEKLLALLADAGVEFILVGGVAVTLHGYATLSRCRPDAPRPASMSINKTPQTT